MMTTTTAAPRQLLAALALGLALVAGLAQAARFRPDCSNTFTGQGASFSTFESVCGQITDEALFRSALELGELKKLEIVESCACALINHELAWAALMTREVDTFYLAIKQFVDERRKEDEAIKGLAEGADTRLLFKGRDGERRYYWDSLDYILKQASGEQEEEEISQSLRKNFAQLYYEPATLKLKFAELVHSQKLGAVISAMCHSIVQKFARNFLPYFDRLSQLAENEHLFFTLTAYNDDLYKLRMNTRTCLYLAQKGHLAKI